MHALIISPSISRTPLNLFCLNKAAKEMVSICRDNGEEVAYIDKNISTEVAAQNISEEQKILAYYGPLACEPLPESQSDLKFNIRDFGLNNSINDKSCYIISTNGMDFDTLGKMFVTRGARAFIGFKNKLEFLSDNKMMGSLSENSEIEKLVFDVLNHVLISICSKGSSAKEAVENAVGFCEQNLTPTVTRSRKMSTFCYINFLCDFKDNIDYYPKSA